MPTKAATPTEPETPETPEEPTDPDEARAKFLAGEIGWREYTAASA